MTKDDDKTTPVEIDMTGEISVSEMINYAIRLAKEGNAPVTFKLSGVKMLANEHSTLDDLIEHYYACTLPTRYVKYQKHRDILKGYEHPVNGSLVELGGIVYVYLNDGWRIGTVLRRNPNAYPHGVSPSDVMSLFSDFITRLTKKHGDDQVSVTPLKANIRGLIDAMPGLKNDVSIANSMIKELLSIKEVHAVVFAEELAELHGGMKFTSEYVVGDGYISKYTRELHNSTRSLEGKFINIYPHMIDDLNRNWCD